MLTSGNRFTFALPENTATLLPVAGLVLVKPAGEEGPKDDKGGPIVRPYTPVSPGDTPGEVTFLIKKYDTGKVCSLDPCCIVHVHLSCIGSLPPTFTT